jgi:hypothetical protein
LISLALRSLGPIVPRAYNFGPAELQNRCENNLDDSSDFAALVLVAYQRYHQAKHPKFSYLFYPFVSWREGPAFEVSAALRPARSRRRGKKSGDSESHGMAASLVLERVNSVALLCSR